MLSPKDKAKELVDSMGMGASKSLDHNTGDYNSNHLNPYAKECALKTVDEIIDVLSDVLDQDIIIPYFIYWNQVKNQIQQL